ncbi:uncharacterized protein MONOS_7782 [Monocercomonoides exilis]|uniref:uncharacterized protein n=1 Tax=Monocercomonoides exilis TaxID=2049356 RepID=UPI00355A2D6D|nr:hypothetical protein MONOS_7782 [Monocercomonoides exilis]|eukprot:MONOS_7782.1-p1 / transcript=MONOS_7782.1 / gene=MONOS_7782 / organism=Monocercomonoides_exilis_PA203 / gene_product=unspecified product / transcript_product=unspecified product / location=Mono_scaffold00275:2497-10344(-) / protein_length=2370 / sequence_SO=supercontig / SO=protein_coding / is_pseudo=false
MSCFFCDAYDGGIVPSINNPFASLTASNTSFVVCCRTKNVVCEGTADGKLTPGRQNETENGANTFTWCEWNGSKTTGNKDDFTDDASNGGAIRMYNLNSGELTVSHCAFNDCHAHYRGGGIMCHTIKTVRIENNVFNSCSVQTWAGGGVYTCNITSSVLISGCEFQNCKANRYGGGLDLEDINCSGTGCIEAENGGGESVCVFDCSFSSCSVSSYYGGGMFCETVPKTQFKIRFIQFISCSAASCGGGNPPYGHDIMFFDLFNAFLSSGNPFFECYTTNTNDQRVCYGYDNMGSSWSYYHTEKQWWINNGILNRFVAVDGGFEDKMCGIDESRACKSIGIAVHQSKTQTTLVVMLMEGNYKRETTPIDIESMKVSVIGACKDKSSIGTGALSSVGTLFSVTTGHLGLLHMKVDCNSNFSPSTPSVVVVSDGGGSLSLEDVVITTSNKEGYVISSSLFVVQLSQLSMVGVEIKDMNVSKPLFSEPDLSSSSSSSLPSLSSSALHLTATVSGDSVLANVKVMNVKLTEGDGVVVAKSVKEGEIFSVSNITIEGCECEEGNGGGMSIYLVDNGEVVMNGTTVIDGCNTVNNGGNGGKGGGMMIVIESGECGLTIGKNVEFSKVNGNVASYGKDVFVQCGCGVFLESKLNTDTFAFFDTSVIPSDVLRLSGSENGDERKVIPLFVYLCSMGTKVIVDGSGGNGMDHNHCGFESFRCQTVDYCANSRMSSTANEIEVVSSSSITKEITGPSFDVNISGRIVSFEEGERILVNVIDGGSATQDWLVGCSSSLTMSRLSFVVKGQLNSRRSAFILSNSTLSVTNCSVSFESGSLTDGKIGYNVISIEGGELIMNGFVMEGPVTTNGKSPISMKNVMRLEMNNSRMSGVEVTGGIGGGCLNVGMNEEGGSVNTEESYISSVCSGGSGMKGGGIMISVGKGGSLEMKNVNLSGCEVPSEDREDGGRGIGGGMFVELPNQMGSFVMEGMTFEGCNAWKGKNMFVSGWDLSEIVKKEHLKWEIKEEELGWLDELCGWERMTTGEEGYVIPLVVYLWDNWSGDGFVSKEKGGDFNGCGYSEAPCSSINHLISLRYGTLEKGESRIKISGSGLLQKSILFLLSSSSKTPIVSIEGEIEGTILKVSEGGRNEGEEEGGGMITLNVVASFTNLLFSLPNGLVSHSSLIHSTSSSATLSIMRCSFVCDDATKETKYCLIKADGGSVVIEDCTLSQFSLVKGLVEFIADVKSIDVMNVSVSNTTISGSSLISLSQPSPTNVLINKARENTKQIVRVNSSSFANITCVENRACVMSVGSFSSGMECVIEGCVLTKCMSERSKEGGGMKMLMKRDESEVKVSGCSFGMCVCFTVNGRGGGMMIDAIDPNVEYTETKIPPLELRLENIRFMMNDAFVGKDMFIRCESIASQINERLFLLDFNQESLKSNNSMCGSDGEENIDVDLIPLVTFYYSSQVFVCVNGSDSRQCGAQNNPCESIGNAVQHIERSVVNMIIIDGAGKIGGECVIGDVRMEPVKKTKGNICFDGKIEKTSEEDGIMKFVNESAVERCSFEFGGEFEASHKFILKVKNGSMEMRNCKFISSAVELKLDNTIVSVESGELKMWEMEFNSLHLRAALIVLCEESKVFLGETNIWNVMCQADAAVVVVGGKAEFEMKEMSFENISLLTDGCVMVIDEAEEEIRVTNCSFVKCVNMNGKGSAMEMKGCRKVQLEACLFDGERGESGEKKIYGKTNVEEERCRWEGSLVDVLKSSVMMKDSTISNSPEGGITMSGGSVVIEKGEFLNNNPSIENYPSLRRNIICSDSGILNVMSLKGGDGLERNTSLWMLNDGCSFEGIASERDSSFFISVLESVEAKEEANRMKLTFKGMLLIPCNLSFSVVKRKGEEKEIGHYDFDSKGFLSEREVEGSVAKDSIGSCGNDVEVSVHVLFGNTESPSSTQSFVLKNASESKEKGDENIVESGNKNAFHWIIIVLVLSMLFLIVLIGFIVFVREAEKKNDEMIKKRVYEKSLGHSESSEHLLSESGSTEYILGRDSDKIPQWVLEKVEEEEIRKQTPSPSISSTSTTSTTDSDSTFVRGEDLCPTTSSMSNLVDAMACSSPHEKLIVDLRDSLFMLLHGRNKTKEMAIGTLQEREMTAAQILFWVANGALHSFEEMENPLQSLSSLSPHIGLFSEHMVICIVMHSDLLSDDDSDSSSVSSSTAVTSASDDDDEDSLPSSAFEDEDSFKKECLRWKAPEMLINKKLGATKKSVVFSIGMMLWECLTLQIPFGDFEAELAGQKIVNGESAGLEKIRDSTFYETTKSAMSIEPFERPTLITLKRKFYEHFPSGTNIVTVSDAVDFDIDEDEEGGGSEEKNSRNGFKSDATFYTTS